jgi:hypothetical protein
MSGVRSSLLGETIKKIFQSDNIDEIMGEVEKFIKNDSTSLVRAQIFRSRPSGGDMKIAEVTSGPKGMEYKAEKKQETLTAEITKERLAMKRKNQEPKKTEFKVEMEMTKPKEPTKTKDTSGQNSAAASINNSADDTTIFMLEKSSKKAIDDIDRELYVFNKRCCCVHEADCQCDCPRAQKIVHQEGCECKCKCFCGTEDEDKNIDYDVLLRDKIKHCESLMEAFCGEYCRVCPSRFNAHTVLPDMDSIGRMLSPLARNYKMQYKVVMSTLRKSVVNFNILHFEENGQFCSSCNNFSGFIRYDKDFKVADSTILCAMYQYYLALRANTAKHDNAEVSQIISRIPGFDFEPNVDYWLSGKISCRLIYNRKIERNRVDGSVCVDKIPSADRIEVWFETSEARRIEKPFVSTCECEGYELHNSLHKNDEEIYKSRSTLQLFYYRLMDYYHMPIFMEYHFVKPEILSSFDQMMQQMFAEEEKTPLSTKLIVFDADSMMIAPEDYVQIRENLLTTMRASTSPVCREHIQIVEEAHEATKLALAGKYKPNDKK